MSLDELVGRARDGNQRALARLATLIENDAAQAAAIRELLQGAPPTARIVGITGPPGAGKSSLLSSVAKALVSADHSVAIIAIDPTSPLTGGATLGDRIRMSEVALNPRVFVRSQASRSRVDGLAPAAQDLIRLFDAAGFDYIFLETVGAGQNQVDIASYVHTLVLVEAPGAGDSVQMLKAGIMEVADIFAVTKSDLPGAQLVSRELRSMLTLAEGSNLKWHPPVVLCSNETGDGIAALVQSIDDHGSYLRESGLIRDRNRTIARSEVGNALMRIIDGWLASDDHSADLLAAISARELTPDLAARRIITAVANDTATDESDEPAGR